MQAFHKAPLWASLFIVIDFLCLIAFLRAGAMAKWFMDYSNKRRGAIRNYSVFMASCGTGKVDAIAWNYRIIFAFAIAWISLILLAAH